MEGYSVTEAASILGVPTERVWELLARGVLAGTSEGEAGMRVFLQPRPAPAPAPITNEPGRSNGNTDEREPERELSPFRELLTEFRNLTERYGQALLALGESRGEVATLRSRVDLLEARMDMRLPMAGFTPPAPSSPWPSASAERAVSPRSDHGADVHGADEGEDDHDRPARRRRSTQRRATEAFAEALARAEDPTRSELPGASDVATALAALRDEPAPAAGASANEAVLPRELPAADLMPLADDEPMPKAVAAAPEPVAVEQPEPEPEVVAAAPEPVAFEQPEPEPEVVAAEPEPVAVEQPEPEPEVVAAAPEPVAFEEPEPEPELVAAERTVHVEPVAEVSSAPDVTPTEEPEIELAAPVEAAADVDAAAPAAEGAPILEPDGQPAPEDVPVAADPEPEADVVEAVTAEPPSIGEEPEAEEAAMDLEPARAVSVDGMPERALDQNVAAGAEAATGEPDAVEPIFWDRERYTVDIEEPDWFAGEEPQPGGHAARDEAPATEDEAPEPSAARADVDSFGPDAAAPGRVPEPPPSAARHDEETMLWFGRQPALPPASEPAAVDERADDGANEMEVAGSGHRAVMPGSQELDEALAALDALGRGRAEPPSTDAPDEPVAETPAEAWPRADTSAWTSPPPSQPRPTPTPASRAYRRLRRIFPG